MTITLVFPKKYWIHNKNQIQAFSEIFVDFTDWRKNNIELKFFYHVVSQFYFDI